MRALGGWMALVVVLAASSAASAQEVNSVSAVSKCPRLSDATRLRDRPGAGRLRGDIDGDGRSDDVSIGYAPAADASCGFVLVVRTRSKNFAFRLVWGYKPGFKIAARDVWTPEPFLAAIVRLDARRAQIVVARDHGAANANVTFIGIARGKLVLLPFQPREYQDELSLFGTAGTGMTNALCRLGGPLVVLGLAPTSYTGKRWFFTRAEYRLTGGRLRKTRSESSTSSRRRAEALALAHRFNALPFTGCAVMRGRHL